MLRQGERCAYATVPRLIVTATSIPTHRDAGAGRWLAPVLVCGAGLLALFHPTLLSGFGRIQTDVGDTRLNNYVLEHSYRWVTWRLPGSFWDPPIFFPVRNTAGYTDILLGVAPVYWVWRLVGFLPDTAFQLWQLSIAIIDFAAFHWWLRRDFAVRPFSAAMGAALFTFGAPRVAQTLHFQLFPQFFTIAVLHGLYRAFQGPATEARRAWSLVLAGFLLQLYAGYYLGWFLFFGLFVGALWAWARKSTRPRFREILLRDRKLLLTLGVVGIVVLLPMAVPYLKAAQSTRPRLLSPLLLMLPRPISWFTADPDNWLYGWTMDLAWIKAIPYRTEHALTFGLFTLAVGALGLRRGWKRPGLSLMVFVALTIMVLVTLWAPGRTLWQPFWAVFPGARALRSMGRIVLLIGIPLSVGLALFLDSLLDRGRTLTAGLVGLLCFAEQVHTTPSFNKQTIRDRLARYESTIPPGCKAFLLTPRLKVDKQPDWLVQVDALWLSMETGLPTLNGYSGNEPIGWPFHDATIIAPEDEPRLSGALETWTHKQHLDPTTTCWLTPDG